MSDENRTSVISLTADIAAAYVSSNNVPGADLPAIIRSIHDALTSAAAGSAAKEVEAAKAPAVPIKRSITPDAIICLEDGRRFKSLKRHLRTRYNLSPEAYRTKWGLPSNYPMVAPNYAAARSDLAKKMGLGQKSRQPVRKPRAPKSRPAS